MVCHCETLQYLVDMMEHGNGSVLKFVVDEN